MTIAPAPGVPEKGMPVYERQLGSESRFPGGPRRFEEGVASDTDVPNDFNRDGGLSGLAYNGLRQGASRANPAIMIKPAAETMRERAHVGSASWVEAPTVLSEFADGASAGQAMPAFEMIRNPGTHMNRPNVAAVDD